MEEKWQMGCGCFTFIVIILVIYFTGGLWRTEIVYSPPGATVNMTDVVEFKEDLNARHWVGGTVKGQQPEIQPVIDKYLGEGRELMYLSIITKHSFVDNLLFTVTLGIYSPVTVTVKGAVGKR